MANKISVFIKEPGKVPRHVNISATLENLQKVVGGYIETVTLADDFVVICNEEGRLLGLEPCCEVCGINFVGPVIFAGRYGDDFCDVPIGFDELRREFPDLWDVKGGGRDGRRGKA